MQKCEWCSGDASEALGYTVVGNCTDGCETDHSVAGTRLCLRCMAAYPGTGALYPEIRRRRAAAKATELESLEFVAPRDAQISRIAGYTHPGTWQIRRGDRLHYRRTGSPDWVLSGPVHIGSYCIVQVADVPRIHAELVALRDSTPDAREEKPNTARFLEGLRQVRPDPYAKCRDRDEQPLRDMRRAHDSLLAAYESAHEGITGTVARAHYFVDKKTMRDCAREMRPLLAEIEALLRRIDG